MRFNRRNWNKFFDGSNKKTTIRLRKSKLGHHKSYAGSYYNPIVLGEFDIVKVEPVIFQDLNEQDAKDDGFDSLGDLIVELVILKGNLELNTVLHKHWIENVVKNESA